MYFEDRALKGILIEYFAWNDPCLSTVYGTNQNNKKSQPLCNDLRSKEVFGGCPQPIGFPGRRVGY